MKFCLMMSLKNLGTSNVFQQFSSFPLSAQASWRTTPASNFGFLWRNRGCVKHGIFFVIEIPFIIRWFPFINIILGMMKYIEIPFIIRIIRWFPWKNDGFQVWEFILMLKYRHHEMGIWAPFCNGSNPKGDEARKTGRKPRNYWWKDIWFCQLVLMIIHLFHSFSTSPW